MFASIASAADLIALLSDPQRRAEAVSLAIDSPAECEAALLALGERIGHGKAKDLGRTLRRDGTARARSLRLLEPGDQAAPVDGWQSALRYRRDKSTGEFVLRGTLTNATLLLLHHEAFAGCWRLDTCSGAVMLARSLPAIEGMQAHPAPAVVADGHVAYVVAALGQICDLSIPSDLAAKAIEAAADQARYNSLTEHLDALQWDGVPRLDRWLADYFGAPDDDYTRTVGRWWLISAMARAYHPGCQVDHMIVMEGGQGAGKSTAVGILGGQWTLHKLPSLRDYDRAALALAGKWIAEIAEMDALRGAAVSQIKEYVSLPSDDYRPPYGRYFVHRPRCCVFVATTNESTYLHDATGARRFWPVRVGRIDRAALTRDREGLLAEAREAYRAGEPYWPTEGDRAMLEGQQDARYQGDAIEDPIAKWLDGRGPTHGMVRDGVSLADVLTGALQLDAGRWDTQMQQRVGQVMRRLGWTAKRTRGKDGGQERRYWRVSAAPEPTEPDLMIDGADF